MIEVNEFELDQLYTERDLYFSNCNDLEQKLAEAEYQLEQQKIMNPISVNMIATISDLSKKLKVAVKALEFYANNKTTMHLEDGIYLRDGMDGQFVPLKDISIYALKEITNVSEKDKA